MTHQVQYKVGKELFSPSRYSGGEHLIAVVTKIGTKYVQAVNKKYHGTEDEKEMTMNYSQLKQRVSESNLSCNHLF